MNHLLLVVLAACAALPLSAQATASYAPYGSGCSGTGPGMGAGHAVPQALATSFMPSNNASGFLSTPQRYQQLFLASELPNAFVMNGLGLRWDNQTSLQISGAIVSLEIKVGFTTKTPATISTTYANNFDAGAPVTVFARANVTFPDYPGAFVTDPTQFQVLIPWTSTFAWTPQSGLNLLVDIAQYGSNLGTGFTYVFDAGWSPSIARVFGPLASPTGMTDGFAYGYVMRFMELTNTAVPVLAGGDTPQFGNQVPIRLTQATPSTIAILLTGLSATQWNGVPLPLPLDSLGASGCDLLTSWDFDQWVTVGANGRGTGLIDVPNDFTLNGVSFFNQFAVYDPLANAFGFALTNAGHGVIGN